MSVFEAIRKVVRQYEDENGFINLIREGSDTFNISLNLEDEIVFLLLERGIENIVELVETYNDGFRAVYALCVSYIENGELKTYNLPVNA